YSAVLLVIDYRAVLLADLTAVALLDKVHSGFNSNLTLFNTIVYALLPLLWLIVLWGNGAYDRRYLGIGTDEFKRVVRASLIVASIVSFSAFASVVQPSRLSVATALVGAAVYISVLRYLARRVLYLLRTKGK